jgi:hypothetical protein
MGLESGMKKLIVLLFLVQCVALIAAIPPPYQPTQLTTNVAKASASNSVFVVTNSTSGMGEWRIGYVDNLNGQATNLTVRSPSGGPSLALTVETNTLVVTNGFVGIGTNAPTRRLNVVNDSAAALRVQRASSSSIAGTAELYNMNTTDGNSISLDFLGDTTGAGASSGTSFGVIRSLMTTHDHATRAGDLLLMTAGSSGATEKVRIKSLGQVGIGTNNPGAGLHVVGEMTTNLFKLGNRVFGDVFTVNTNGVLIWPTNTITVPPVLDLGSFSFWNSNGMALWKCWNTNGSTVCAPLP